MKNIYRFVFLMLTLNAILISNDSIAQTNFWQKTNGPAGGTVLSFATGSNGEIYAGTKDDGVYRSVDNGYNWSKLNLTFNFINAVNGIVLNSAGHIFCTTSYGVYRTTDNGSSWIRLTNGITAHIIYSCLLKSLGGSNEHIFIGTDSCVFRTTDNGESWVQMKNGMNNTSVLNLTMNPSGWIWAGTSNNGAYVSSDNGLTWIQKNNGLIYTRIISFASAQSAYVNFWLYAGTNGGVFKSTDNGSSWTKMNSGLTNLVILSLSVNIHGVCVGTDDGVFKSTNSGSTWIPMNNGLHNPIQVLSFTISNSPNNDILAGTDIHGIYRSVDNGSTWTKSNNGLINTHIYCIALNGDRHIFCGTDNAGIYRSTNNGVTYEQVNSGLPLTEINALVIGKTGLSKGIFYGGTTAGVFRSTNSGNSWDQLLSSPVNSAIRSISILEDNQTAPIIIAGATQGKIMRSTNDGKSWNDKILSTNVYDYVSSITATTKGDLFAGTFASGVFRSGDKGETWSRIISDTVTTNGYILGSSFNGDVFACGKIDTVLHSTDNGDSWSSSQLPFGMGYLTSIVINSSGHVYASNSMSGVARSTDNGNSWDDLSSGLSNHGVLSLSISSDGFIYAGSNGFGVFRSATSTPVETVNLIPTSFYLDQIYPNPISQKSTIQFSLPSSGNVTLKIYDVLGKEVETLVNDVRDAGKYSVNWNARNRSSGMYLCRLTMNNMSVTKTIICMK